MIFSSYAFIFAFLPVVLPVFFAAARWAGNRAALAWLAAASIVFYAAWKEPGAAWSPIPLFLFVGSIGINFLAGAGLSRRHDQGRPLRGLLVLGIAVNLGLLAVFKYTGFIVAQVNAVASTGWSAPRILLPLGISFYTFQQIAYLVDASRGACREYRLLDYALFVSFFPQLIAGPIVHHGEMMPQFRRGGFRFDADAMALGWTLFILGAFKKLALADPLGGYADPVFAAVKGGAVPSFLEAWLALLAFSFQIYFDFSAYSDMALGLGRMVGVVLPFNFDSPYKAASIIEFWHRWHITLFRFLRDYLYRWLRNHAPLPGGPRSPGRRAACVWLTMVAAGLWHGPAWTFIAFGALHGLLLVANYAWRRWREGRFGPAGPGPVRRAACVLVTYLIVVWSGALFRGSSLEDSLRLWAGAAGANGISVSDHLQPSLGFLGDLGVRFEGLGAFKSRGIRLLLLAAAIVFLCPNTLEWAGLKRRPVGAPWRLTWAPTGRWAFAAGALAVYVFLLLGRVQSFIYFQF